MPLPERRMPPRQRMAWWYGFAAVYVVVAVVLLVLAAWLPAAVCAAVGLGLAVPQRGRD